jgi:arsenical pump membrane protein
VLVAGLLLLGLLAAQDGLFEAAGFALARLPGGGGVLLCSLLLLEAVVTAVLNLDTAVVFMTPVLLHAARRRGHRVEPFLYGAVSMANAASLLLPGSNLTNLIVLSKERIPGAVFADRIAPAWAVSVASTIVFLLVVFRRDLRLSAVAGTKRPAFRPGLGLVGVVGATALVLALSRPALPVLAFACALALVARIPARRVLAATNPVLLVGVFGVAVALGTLGRGVASLGDLTMHVSSWASAGLGAGSALLVNNLPAAAMLSAHRPAHPRALLVGLDLGPNLAVTGSLSAVLWLQVARAAGAEPSVRRYFALGLVLVPASIALAVLALSISPPPGL